MKLIRGKFSPLVQANTASGDGYGYWFTCGDGFGYGFRLGYGLGHGSGKGCSNSLGNWGEAGAIVETD